MEQNNTKQTVERRLEAALEQLKVAPLSATAEQIDALWGPAREAYRAYIAAMDAFDADLKERQNILDQQGRALDAQVRALEMEIKTLEDRGREAASRGDLDTAAQLDERSEDLQKQVATARRKRRLADGAALRGDAGNFAAIQEKQAAYTATLSLCGEYVREAVAAVREWQEHFARLERETRWAANRGPAVAGVVEKRWLEIDKNFRREFYQQLEAQAAVAQAEEKAEQALREVATGVQLRTF